MLRESDLRVSIVILRNSIFRLVVGQPAGEARGVRCPAPRLAASQSRRPPLSNFGRDLGWLKGLGGWLILWAKVVGLGAIAADLGYP